MRRSVAGGLSVDLELVAPGEFCLLTDAGLVRVISPAQADEAEINLPDCDVPRDLAGFPAQPGEHWFALGIVGVPHLVVRVNDIESVDVTGRGRLASVGPTGRAGGRQRELRESSRRVREPLADPDLRARRGGGNLGVRDRNGGCGPGSGRPGRGGLAANLPEQGRARAEQCGLSGMGIRR